MPEIQDVVSLLREALDDSSRSPTSTIPERRTSPERSTWPWSTAEISRSPSKACEHRRRGLRAETPRGRYAISLTLETPQQLPGVREHIVAN